MEKGSRQGLLRFGIIGVISVQYFYTLSFNYMPGGIRLGLAGSIELIYLFLSIYAAIARPSGWSRLIGISTFMLIISWVVSYFETDNAFDIQIVSRDILPYVSVIWVLSYPEAIPWKLLRGLAVISLLVGSTVALLGDAATIGGITRLAYITGVPYGTDGIGLHPSAYFILLNVLVIDQLRNLGAIRPLFAWALIALGVIVLLGYVVRTTLVMLLVYGLIKIYYQLKNVQLFKPLVFFSVFMGIIGLFGWIGLTTSDLGELGSGRFSSYVHRFELLQNRGVSMLVFGSGPGTDLFTTDVWWYEAKGAHNDFIHAIVERGLMGMGGMVLFLFALGVRLTDSSKALLFAVIAGSAISNGLFSRPSVIPYLFFAMGLALNLYSAQDNKQLSQTSNNRPTAR